MSLQEGHGSLPAHSARGSGRASRNSAPQHSPGPGRSGQPRAQVPRRPRDSQRFPKPPAPAARTEALLREAVPVPQTGDTVRSSRRPGGWQVPWFMAPSVSRRSSGLPAREPQPVPDTAPALCGPSPAGRQGYPATPHTGRPPGHAAPAGEAAERRKRLLRSRRLPNHPAHSTRSLRLRNAAFPSLGETATLSHHINKYRKQSQVKRQKSTSQVNKKNPQEKTPK